MTLSPPTDLRTAFNEDRIWNGWSKNLISVDAGYIIHAVIVDGGNDEFRSLCGVQIVDGGWLSLGDFTPGCARCRAILKNAGLLEPT